MYDIVVKGYSECPPSVSGTSVACRSVSVKFIVVIFEYYSCPVISG